MKAICYILLIALIIFILQSCNQAVSTKTIVHEDGSIVREITFDNAEASILKNNMFGVNVVNGWSIDSVVKAGEDKKKSFSFTKTFSSVSESNRELNSSADTLFKIESGFEKKFRWFYSYIKYTDSYKKIDRFKEISSTDFFVQEDFAFIDRMPASNRSLNKADSVVLAYLNDRIFEDYAMRGYFEHHYNTLLKCMEKYNTPSLWYDSMRVHKERLYQTVKEQDEDVGAKALLKIADSLGVPFPEGVTDEIETQFASFHEEFETRAGFMGIASEAEYHHSIEMPWEIVSTNADSVSHNSVYWNPRVVKFLLADYEMYAESRKINYWAFGVTLLCVGIFIYLMLKRRKS